MHVVPQKYCRYSIIVTDINKPGSRHCVMICRCKRVNISCAYLMCVVTCQTPLHLAVITGQLEVVVCLLEAGASPNCTDRKGLNSLHLAVVSSYVECLRALLTLGHGPVDLNAMNYEGEIPYVPIKYLISVLLGFVLYYC